MLPSLQTALAGRYEIQRELGRGGMGVVYLARDVALERLVAIKVLPPELAAQPDLRERFLRETRTAAGLSHPNIVAIHAVEEREGLVYFVMGYVDGETLSQRIRRVGPMPPTEVARIMQESAWALGYAHGRGIVHRDVKPDNIMVERATGRAFITDFGIARAASAATMTSAGMALGTPQFMSPEQAAGEKVDGRSDLYSLGITAFVALTGQVPFDGPTVQSILAMHLTKPAPHVASLRSGIPAKLADAIDRCLAKEPDARFPTAEALVEAIEGIRGEPEVAAPIRGFMRTAETGAVQIFTLFLLLVAIAEAKASGPMMIPVVLAVFMISFAVQLAAQARALVASGFGYEDVRSAIDRQAREMAEIKQTMAAQITPGRRRLARALLMTGVTVAVLALVFGIPSQHGTFTNVAAKVALYLSIPLVFIGMLFRLAGDPIRSHRPSQWAGRLLQSKAGEAFFRLVSRGRPTGTAPVTVAAGLDTLISQLPSGTRRQLGPLRDAASRLDTAARALAQREAELERSGRELTGGTGGGADADRRRAEVVAELERERNRVSESRTQVNAALEGLRLQVVRVRSGLATPAEITGEVESARELANRVSGR